MNRLRRLAVSLRAPDWFFSKLPALLFIGVCAASMTDASPRSIAKKSLVWLASIVAMAVIGYVLNDHFDRESDARSGKYSAALPPRGVIAACGAALLVESLLLVIGRPFAFAAVLISNGIAAAYSAPPLRLKERGAAGIVADAAAAWLAPVTAILGVAWPSFPFVERQQALFALSAMLWALLYGVRGIVVHQLWDERRDAAAGLRTFVVRAGAPRACRLIRAVLFPIEVMALTALVITAGYGLTARISVVAAYIAYDAFRWWRWDFKVDPAPLVCRYILGAELIEVWLPLLQVCVLVVDDRGHLYFLAAWLVAFHAALLPRIRELGAAVAGLLRGMTARLRWAVVAVLCVAGVEAVLQAGAFALWVRSRPEPAAAGGNTVLCVGDSFTYGFGASDRTKSYPAQLQSIVGPSLRVINRGWPGQSSFDVVSRLRELLRATQPRVVYVIVGANDGWSRPGIYAGHEAHGDEFELRCRMLRLARLGLAIMRGPRTEAAVAGAAAAPANAVPAPAVPAAAAPFGGTWYSSSEPVTFGADGFLQYGPSGMRVRYEIRGDTIVLSHAVLRRRFRWKLEGDRLVMGSEDTGPPWVLTRTPHRVPEGCVSGDPLAIAAGWSALGRGDLEIAEGCFRVGAESEATVAPAGAGLVQVYLRRDLRERAAEELAKVERAYARAPGPLTAQALVDAAASLSAPKGIALARTMLAKYPENASLWKTLGWQSFVAGDRVTAAAAIDNAVRFAGGSSPDERAYYYFLRAEITRESSPEAALRDTLLCYAEKRDDATLRSGLRDVSAERLAAALDASPLPAAAREHVREVFRDSAAPDHARLRSVLTANLRAAVRECRRAGAAVVLASYPFEYGDVDDVARRVGADMNVPWLNLHDEFERRLQGRQRSELFVPDGHCNDRGYRLMAEMISRDLRERVNREGEPHGTRSNR